jgi:hypothetical protein
MLRFLAGLLMIVCFFFIFNYLPDYLVTGVRGNIIVLLYFGSVFLVIVGGRWRR